MRASPELDEWWNHEPHSLEIEPSQIPSEGSRRQVMSPQVSTVLHSEEECRQSDPTPPESLVECVQERPCPPGFRDSEEIRAELGCEQQHGTA